jgi:arsenite-transporting ATPase
MNLTSITTRYLFFTGKGGVGKTSISCATAISLADKGRRVLLVSTDPASNLDEVLGVKLGSSPTAVPGVARLEAMNLDPELAAKEYRDRMVGPYRGVLPAATVRSMEEQLSGSCTMEIAAFDEFSRLLGDPARTSAYDHVIFDTAPTGHTLRLLSLPHAWSSFLETNTTGTSCLGPLAGLKEQQGLYLASVKSLADSARTTLVLVSRPEVSALREAERSSAELRELGVSNQCLVLNGVFRAVGKDDPVATAFERRGREALAAMPPGIGKLPRQEVRLSPRALLGADALRAMFDGDARPGAANPDPPATAHRDLPPGLIGLVDDLERAGKGVIMTMGKGGVGKTTVAAAIALELARRGHAVHLSTTDPAAHVSWLIDNPPAGLKVGRIDAVGETEAYRDEVMGAVGTTLDAQGRALLAEDMRSPCTEEVAVFRTFARTVAEGKDGFVVLDTAPTGHTILLLDAAEAYHREVLRQSSNMPETVRELLPRLRDPESTRILLVTLAEATPVHEAARLQSDLARAEIHPFAWVINQALSPVETADPVLRSRRADERAYIDEVTERLAKRVALVPWLAEPPVGTAGLVGLLSGSPDSGRTAGSRK